MSYAVGGTSFPLPILDKDAFAVFLDGEFLAFAPSEMLDELGRDHDVIAAASGAGQFAVRFLVGGHGTLPFYEALT